MERYEWNAIIIIGLLFIGLFSVAVFGVWSISTGRHLPEDKPDRYQLLRKQYINNGSSDLSCAELQELIQLAYISMVWRSDEYFLKIVETEYIGRCSGYSH